MEKGVIYKIENLTNNKKYIGQTNNLKRRWKQHRVRSNQVIDKAIDKYGVNNFEIKVLEKCDLNLMSEREKYWIKKYNTYKGYGYNCTPGGEALFGEHNPRYGKEFNHTDESKRKMSLSRKGVKFSEAHKNNLSESIKKFHSNNKHPWEGGHHTEETKKIISQKRKGAKHTEETKEKMSKIRIKSGASKGHNNPNSIVDEKMAKKMIIYYNKTNCNLEKLASEFNVSFSVAEKVTRKEHWASKNLSIKVTNKNVQIRKKVNKKTAKEIFKKYHENSNLTQSKLGEEYNLSQVTVSNIVRAEHRFTKNEVI